MVKAGDKVTFPEQVDGAHTASFFGTQPPIQNPEDPKAQAPSGKSPLTLDATGFFNTGFVRPTPRPARPTGGGA